MEKVVQAVKEVFGPLNPREDITLQKLSELTVMVRKKIEGFTEEERKCVSSRKLFPCDHNTNSACRNQKWLSYLLPPSDHETYLLQAAGMTSPSDPTSSSPISPALRHLLDETSDLIDSPPFTHVLTLLLDSAFSLLIDTKIATLAYKIAPPSASTSRVVEIVGPGTDVKTKVASTLATFSRQAHSIGSSSGNNNEYLTAMESVRDLEAFAAVVYSSNFEAEAPEMMMQSAAGLGAGWENVSIPPSGRESMVVVDDASAGVTSVPSGVLKATEVEEVIPEVGEADLEKAWGKATETKTP
jgi:peroxin-3